MTKGFIGFDLRYPVIFASNGTASLVSELDSLEQSIKDIILTPIGTRFFERSYGSRIYRLLFDKVNTDNLSLLSQIITEDIRKNETRAIVLDVRVSVLGEDSEAIGIQIDFSNADRSALGTASITVEI